MGPNNPGTGIGMVDTHALEKSCDGNPRRHPLQRVRKKFIRAYLGNLGEIPFPSVFPSTLQAGDRTGTRGGSDELLPAILHCAFQESETEPTVD